MTYPKNLLFLLNSFNALTKAKGPLSRLNDLRQARLVVFSYTMVALGQARLLVMDDETLAVIGQYFFIGFGFFSVNRQFVLGSFTARARTNQLARQNAAQLFLDSPTGAKVLN